MAEIEIHPFPPFIAQDSRILIMGTFPPQSKRWGMDFYYPNPINDFWRIMGLIFKNDKNAFYDTATKKFDKEAIIEFLREHRIALSDTGYRIKRLKGNASDKFLEIVEPVDLKSLLRQMPECKNIATTGEKAAFTLATLTDTVAPGIGESVESADGITIWRMPSTSRAYPLPLEKKAIPYRKMFEQAGILNPSQPEDKK